VGVGDFFGVTEPRCGDVTGVFFRQFGRSGGPEIVPRSWP